MVVFVDYDQHPLSTPDSLFRTSIAPGKLALKTEDPSILPDKPAVRAHDSPRQAPNQEAFSAALNCYPIVKEITRSIDLNTLHALSQTCRQVHANIAPFRPQLARQTLRCENEYIETLSDLLASGAAVPESIKSVIRTLSHGTDISPGRLTRGKVGKCARDMVAECRRCSRVVCRNCTIKAPSSSLLKNRIRRLCTTCRTAPLKRLTCSPTPDTNADASPWLNPLPTTTAFSRTPCTCPDSVWLCHQCGQTLRGADTTYHRVWSWRTRYSTCLGGLGTGIGEGCQGVKCGRGEECLAARETEVEVDCEADDSLHCPSARDEGQPGYFRQEIVGIGGVVKQKAKKRVTVGECVVEYEDERASGRYIEREAEGRYRGWCGWCWRIIPAGHEAVA